MRKLASLLILTLMALPALADGPDTMKPAGGVKPVHIDYRPSPTVRDPAIEKAVLAEITKDGGYDHKARQDYDYAKVSLSDGPSPEVVVLLDGPGGYAGSGGCTFAILSPTSSGYKWRGTTRLIHPPLVVTPEKSHGWHDLVVWMGGGGGPQGYVTLAFNGTRYPQTADYGQVLKAGTSFTGPAFFAWNNLENPKRLQLVIP